MNSSAIVARSEVGGMQFVSGLLCDVFLKENSPDYYDDGSLCWAPITWDSRINDFDY